MKKMFTARGVSGWSASIFGKGREYLHVEVRSGRPPINFLGIRIMSLRDEGHFIGLIRLLMPGEFLTQLY
jgi:hypothetical protein